MLERAFVQKLVRITTQRNSAGDIVRTGAADQVLYGRFREVSRLTKMNNREEIRSEAQAWFPPTTVINRGDILFTEDGEYYEVAKLAYARKLGSDTVEFLKISLEKHMDTV